MTDSGVLMAWARLPTWVRARSTISRLASISALVSRASGAISTGNSPSSRSARPERIAARLSEMRLSGDRPKRPRRGGGQDQRHFRRREDRADEGVKPFFFRIFLGSAPRHLDEVAAVV